MNAVQKPKRNTWQREAVRTALSSTEGFVSAQALHQHLRDDGSTIGLATVYRACTTDKHHHHLICRNCGRTVEIEADPVERWAQDVAAANGFTNASHVVDIFGECADCTAARAGA